MDIVNADVIASLIASRGDRLVSLYLPTHRLGTTTRQDPIRLKNLLGEARTELIELGMRGPAADERLAPARKLLDDQDFWQHQEDGLAVFLDGDGMRHFRLPARFDEIAVVGDHHHVKPLLRVMSRGERYHLLALSENRVRLLGGTRFRIGPIELPSEVPTSLAEALWFEDPEAQLQFHQAARTPTGFAAIFHGHGGGKDQPQEEIERFFRAVDAGLGTIIERGTPLVLAGVESHLPIYRRVSRHEPILDGEILGSPDRLSDEELHERAWSIVEPYFARERDEALEIVVGGGPLVARGLEPVLTAARAGRVSASFVARDRSMWGVAGEGEMDIELHDDRMPGDRDLLDVTVAETWIQGGTVWALPAAEIPGGDPVAAVLRY